jgi:hypothetical protein
LENSIDTLDIGGLASTAGVNDSARRVARLGSRSRRTRQASAEEGSPASGLAALPTGYNKIKMKKKKLMEQVSEKEQEEQGN